MADTSPLQLFENAKLEKRSLYTAAPMVRYSKLAFRQTVAHFGVDMCWTPMILAKEFNRSILARDSAQFGANSPLELARATTLISPYVSGIDINCGCPQSWACAENLGAALMNNRELVASMIKASKNSLTSLGYGSTKTVSVKIRIHKDLRQTLDFIRIVESAGVDFITIHGRTRSTPSSHPVDLSAISLLTSHITVPTLCNGDVFTLSDAKTHVEKTGTDGVMAARGLLENPALFRGDEGCPWEAVEVFMRKVVRAPIPFKLVVHHLGEMGGSGGVGRSCLFGKEERRGLMACGNMVELMDWLDGVREVRRLGIE